MTDYEIWEKILDSGDIKEIERLLKKVIKDPKIVNLFIEKFKKAEKEYLEEEKLKMENMLKEEKWIFFYEPNFKNYLKFLMVMI